MDTITTVISRKRDESLTIGTRACLTVVEMVEGRATVLLTLFDEPLAPSILRTLDEYEDLESPSENYRIQLRCARFNECYFSIRHSPDDPVMRNELIHPQPRRTQ